MSLDEFVSGYSLDDIIALEFRDEQFLCLHKAWNAIVGLEFFDVTFHTELFLYLVIQNALISYQVAGSGVLWWQEFAETIVEDFATIDGLMRQGVGLIDWRYEFLVQSRYNRRLYNSKRSRLVVFDSLLSSLLVSHSLGTFCVRMEELYSCLLSVRSSYAKTCCFAIKMYGYAFRAISGKVYVYPSTVPIPLDSRLQKIYHQSYGVAPLSTMIAYFSSLAKNHSLAPLHLDSLLWLQYRPTYVQ